MAHDISQNTERDGLLKEIAKIWVQPLAVPG
jgi:hypothetical protein